MCWGLSCWSSTIQRSGSPVIAMRSTGSLQRKFAKLFANILAAQRGSPRASDHHDIDPFLEISSKMPKPLANSTFYPIPDDCSTQLPARSHTQPPQRSRPRLGVSTMPFSLRSRRCDKQYEVGRCHPDPVSGHPLKIPRVEEPLRPPEAPGRRQHGRTYFVPTETVRRFRPFKRRLLSTSWPPRVFIRARNPCLRSRLIRLGW
jgi:hypothetical protein